VAIAANMPPCSLRSSSSEASNVAIVERMSPCSVSYLSIEASNVAIVASTSLCPVSYLSSEVSNVAIMASSARRRVSRYFSRSSCRQSLATRVRLALRRASAGHRWRAMRHGKRHRVPVGRRDHVRACRRRGLSVVAPTKLPVGSRRAARRPEGTRLAPAQGMPMRNSIAFLLISLLAPACSSTSDTGANAPADASGDSGTCTGLPPSICQGCCGSTYAADECVNGTWVCRPLGIACTQCDSGVTDAAASDGSGDSATCTGTPPVICNGCCGSKYAADQCSNGTWACQPRGVACIQCDAAIPDSPAGDASGDAVTDGSGDSG
jgi:hypothetical protein